MVLNLTHGSNRHKAGGADVQRNQKPGVPPVVAARAQKAGTGFTTKGERSHPSGNAADLAKVADTLSQAEAAGRLRPPCALWIYGSCLCFALDANDSGLPAPPEISPPEKPAKGKVEKPT